MKPIQRYWFGEVFLGRPYVIQRFVLMVLAFDLWLRWIPSGAKYGVAGFNVAHFPVLEGFVPSSAFYLGVVAFTGVLALSQALYRPHPIAMTFVFVGYTLGWACSLLDWSAYHYLISLYLVTFVFFPMVSARAAFSHSDRAPLGSAWGYVLFCVTTSIVYFYVAAWAAAAGDPYWLPMVCSGAYAVASMQDRSRSSAARIATPALMIAPVALHVTTPFGGLFSFTMIAIAFFVFAPPRLMNALGRIATVPARVWFEDDSPRGLDDRAATTFYSSLIGLVLAPIVGAFVDLPGVKTGCALTALVMLLVMGRQLYLTPTRRPWWRVASLFGASLAFFVVVTASDVRVGFYQQGAFEAARRGDLETATEFERKAERFSR